MSTSRSDHRVEALGRQLAEALELAGGDTSPLSRETRQRLFAALVGLHARHAGDDGAPPFPPGGAATEDVVRTAADMLRGAEVTSFELAALFNV